MKQAEESYRASANTAGLAMVWGNLGEYHLAREEWDRARDYLLESLRSHRSLKSLDGQAKALTSLLDLTLQSGEIAEAGNWMADLDQIAQRYAGRAQGLYLRQRVAEYGRRLEETNS